MRVGRVKRCRVERRRFVRISVTEKLIWRGANAHFGGRGDWQAVRNSFIVRGILKCVLFVDSGFVCSWSWGIWDCVLEVVRFVGRW